MAGIGLILSASISLNPRKEKYQKKGVTMFTVNGKEYNPVLSARACVTIEDKLGKNPLSIFSTGQPKITDLLIVFGGALGLDDEATYDLFDEYMKENSMKDFTDLILNIFKESGFIGEKDSKNPKKAKAK